MLVFMADVKQVKHASSQALRAHLGPRRVLLRAVRKDVPG